MSLRIAFNHEAFRQLRSEPELVHDLTERAQRIAEAAGEGVEVLPVQEPRERAHVVVGTVTNEASYRAASENTLIRALDAGR
jgi:hypothetical protein